MIQTFGSSDSDSSVLLDVREFGLPSYTNPANGGAAIGVSRVVRKGGVTASSSSNTFNFWGSNPATTTVIYPVANQYYAGNARVRSASRTNNSGFNLFCNYVSTPAGWDPASDHAFAGVRAWPKHELEYTIGKQTTAGFLIAGFSNGGGSAGAWFNPLSIGGLGFGVFSDDLSSQITQILIRNDPRSGGALQRFNITPVECVASLATILFEITYGPSWQLKISINGQVVGTFTAAQMGWIALNTCTSLDDLELVPLINVSPNGAASGIFGPYFSRATIRELPA